jgi:DNA polymerase V
MRDYKTQEAEVIVKEMADQICLDMAAQHLVTESVTLFIGYSHTQGVPGAGGTARLAMPTNGAGQIVPAIATLYKRIVNPSYVIRRVGLCCNNVFEDPGTVQLNLFEDTTRQLRDKALQESLLGIRAKYGKNSILKGMNYTEAATARERNRQIGGHKSGTG